MTKKTIMPVPAEAVEESQGGEPERPALGVTRVVDKGGSVYHVRGDVQRMPSNEFTSEPHIIFLAQREHYTLNGEGESVREIDSEFREYALNVSEVESYE